MPRTAASQPNYTNPLSWRDVQLRFEELKSLKDGWLDGDGIAPTEAGINKLQSAIAKNLPRGIPLPYAYPTPEGGVQLEWTFMGREISLDIELDKQAGDWHSLDMASGVDDSRSISLDSDRDWCWIATQFMTPVAYSSRQNQQGEIDVPIQENLEIQCF